MAREQGPRDSIAAQAISKRYVAGAGRCSIAVTALRRASMEIRCGEVLVVAGPIGSGKTTLLLCAAGLLRCDEGSVTGTARRVVYRDLRIQPRPIERMTRGSILLLDSCDDLPALARARATRAVADALDGGAGVVLAAREAEVCMTIAPVEANISVVHLRMGETSTRRRLPITTRVAEPGQSRRARGAQ